MTTESGAASTDCRTQLHLSLQPGVYHHHLIPRQSPYLHEPDNYTIHFTGWYCSSQCAYVPPVVAFMFNDTFIPLIQIRFFYGPSLSPSAGDRTQLRYSSMFIVTFGNLSIPQIPSASDFDSFCQCIFVFTHVVPTNRHMFLCILALRWLSYGSKLSLLQHLAPRRATNLVLLSKNNRMPLSAYRL